MTAEHAFELPGTELEGIAATQDTEPVAYKVPSCIEIGLQASKKGDFQKARQMFRAAIKQLEDDPNKQAGIMSLIVNIADTYINEGRYDLAKQWYTKALQNSELLPEHNILQFACLMIRLAQINVLQEDMSEYKKSFETVERVYLLSQEADTSVLLDSLIDLSWVLCMQRHLNEAQVVNDLINQIKRLEDEEKLIALFESNDSNDQLA